MIIKNLAAMCRKKKRIWLFEDEAHDVQWAGDGGAIYPLFGIPHLNEEQILILFDVPEDKRKGFAVHTENIMPDGLDTEDSAADQEARPYPISLGTSWGVYYPVQTSTGIAFYDAEYFKPIADKPRAKLYERYTRSGRLYFVAKDGMLVEAVIMPAALKEEELAATLGTIFTELEQKIGGPDGGVGAEA